MSLGPLLFDCDAFPSENWYVLAGLGPGSSRLVPDQNKKSPIINFTFMHPCPPRSRRSPEFYARCCYRLSSLSPSLLPSRVYSKIHATALLFHLIVGLGLWSSGSSQSGSCPHNGKGSTPHLPPKRGKINLGWLCNHILSACNLPDHHISLFYYGGWRGLFPSACRQQKIDDWLPASRDSE